MVRHHGLGLDVEKAPGHVLVAVDVDFTGADINWGQNPLIYYFRNSSQKNKKSIYSLILLGCGRQPAL
jgi:hypothetical protein